MNILFTGDVVLSDVSYSKQKLISEDLQNIFDSYDFIGCNLEGPVLKTERDSIKKAGPAVANGSLAIKRLSEIGINIFMLANNHIMDYGYLGLRDTIEQIQKISPQSSIIGAGFEQEEIYKYNVYKNDGVKVAIINVTESSNCYRAGNKFGYAYMMDIRISENIKKAKTEVDYVIIVCHAGAEDLSVPLPEIRQLYHAYIDLGANVVISHHPHVIQGLEAYKQGLIAYSLGNFAFDSIINPLQPAFSSKGIVIGLHLKKEELTWDIIPIEYRNQKVFLDNLDEFNRCNEALNDKNEYMKLVNEFCKEYYIKYYTSYYCQGLGFHNESIKQRLLFSLKLLFSGIIDMDNRFVYHNVANETNHWICKRAIELVENESDNKKNEKECF